MLRFIASACLLLLACSAVLSATTQPAGPSTVVWVSIDGLRFDYIARAHPPTLERLAKEGAFTTQETPIFPSLTFPNHISQVTGVGVDHHGVSGNSFFDSETGKSYSFPDQATLIRAEPIWITAKRQGVRTAVIDWPMSQNQVGADKSDYFDDRFDEKETDAHRLDRVLTLLTDDKGPTPLRLVMTDVSAVDTTGHRAGPKSKALDESLLATDATLGKFVQGVIDWYHRTHSPGDTLYVVFSTDHGMEPVHTLVSLERLVGGDLLAGAKVAGGGPLANIFLAPDHRDQAAAVVDKLRAGPFVKAWLAKDIPADLHFADAHRVGDVVAVLAPGYTFTSKTNATTQPVKTGPFGMHGYLPADCPNMRGEAIIWRDGQPLGGQDLGPIDNTQWHATIAKLLGIQPAKDANPRAIDLK